MSSPATPTPAPDGRQWEVGFEGVELAQALWAASWPMTEKVKWLEEAQEIAERLAQQHREQASHKPPGPASESPTAQ